MGKNKVLVKVHPEGKYVVDIDKDIDVAKITTGARVALRNDSYTLHLLLPTKVDPLVSLMKVEKVPDSTYDMIGGAEQQIKEIKEVGTLCVRVCVYGCRVIASRSTTAQEPSIVRYPTCKWRHGTWLCVPSAQALLRAWVRGGNVHP